MAEAEASNAVAPHDHHASGLERCAENDLATWAFYFGLTNNSLIKLAEVSNPYSMFPLWTMKLSMNRV